MIVLAGGQPIARQAAVAEARKNVCCLSIQPFMIDKLQANGSSQEDNDWTATTKNKRSANLTETGRLAIANV